MSYSYNIKEKNPMWKGGVNKDKRKYQRKWARKNKDKRKIVERRCRLKRQFGITIEQYNEILNKQDGKCAICFVSQKDYPRRFSIDHNHITKKVRGLLCSQCNSILGYSRDSIETLKRTIEYLLNQDEF